MSRCADAGGSADGAIVRAADEPRILQVALVVAEGGAVRQRFEPSARFGEDQFAGGRIPLVGVGRADVVVDPPFGQQAEFVGTALLDHLGVGITTPERLDVGEGFGGVVRTGDGD